MQDPLISIVIPSCNGQKFIRQAIDSVVNQTYKNWELILVDDGSKDQTPLIMQEYSSKYPNIFSCQHKLNSGLPSALNTGFAIAKGVYYSWIADDNIFKNNALLYMVNELNNSNNYLDIVYANYDVIDKNNLFIEAQEVDKIEKLIFRYIVGPCFLYKAKCHHEIGGYNTAYKMCEDYDFFLRLYNSNFRFGKVDKNLFLYRRHDQAMSSNIKSVILNTEKVIISNTLLNLEKIDRKILAKIYLSRFLKNKYELKINFLLKAYYYHFLYCLVRTLVIIKRFVTF
jgi:glycosyltransferase involved in cell wall biosynthesis